MLTQAPLRVNQIRKRNILDVTSVGAIILSLFTSFDEPRPSYY